jgi:hypothetical protein
LGWLEAKETWSKGCQSLVAILRAKGREMRWLIVGRMARPLGTAREPFCGDVRSKSYLFGIKKNGIAHGRAEIFLHIHYNQCRFEVVRCHVEFFLSGKYPLLESNVVVLRPKHCHLAGYITCCHHIA